MGCRGPRGRRPGGRSAHLDDPHAIFVENLRPQLAAREGYAAEDLAEVRPGIIYARIKLNTVTGPWANWVGFDLSTGAFTGVYTAEGSTEQPRLPGGVHVVVDFLCGMIVAAGVQAALIRRAKEGGSYRVTVTLAQATTGEFTRIGSQVEMSRTPESWIDPILVPLGSSRPEWLPKNA